MKCFIVLYLLTLRSYLRSSLTTNGKRKFQRIANHATCHDRHAQDTSRIAMTLLPQSELEVNSGGAKIHVVFNEPVTIRENNALPPLIFIHGSYHSSWCWQEHYMPYFASRGYQTGAVSLRGTKPSPAANKEVRSIKIQEHLQDLLEVIPIIRSSFSSNLKPIIISHRSVTSSYSTFLWNSSVTHIIYSINSFGGLITMKLLEIESVRNSVSGSK